MVLHLKNILELVAFVVLLSSSISINKYVLSVLSFTFPTIFQGWQTFVGGILLTVLRSKNCMFGSSSTLLDKEGFISLLPSLLFFTAGGVAGSKALAGLSIPVFLSLQSTVNAFLFLLSLSPKKKFFSQKLAVLASLVTLSSACVLVVTDIYRTFSDSPYFWMLVSVACQTVQSLHFTIADARYDYVDRLYFSYIFSVILLAPASLYLEEAFEVLKFPHASRLDFFFGCIFSGIFALLLNLTYIEVRSHDAFKYADTFGRFFLCALSEVLLKEHSWDVNLLVSVTLAASFFVPLPSVADNNVTQAKSDDHVALIPNEV